MEVGPSRNESLLSSDSLSLSLTLSEQNSTKHVPRRLTHALSALFCRFFSAVFRESHALVSPQYRGATKDCH